MLHPRGPQQKRGLHPSSGSKTPWRRGVRTCPEQARSHDELACNNLGRKIEAGPNYRLILQLTAAAAAKVAGRARAKFKGEEGGELQCTEWKWGAAVRDAAFVTTPPSAAAVERCAEDTCALDPGCEGDDLAFGGSVGSRRPQYQDRSKTFLRLRTRDGISVVVSMPRTSLIEHETPTIRCLRRIAGSRACNRRYRKELPLDGCHV